MTTYVAYCLIHDKELNEQQVSKHNEYLCLDNNGNLREGEDEGECTRCWRDVPESELVTYGDWKLCELCQDDI